MLPAPADEELCRRLPLPLAQLYRHAHNAYGPTDRHLHAFYLWEAALRLAASAAIVDYLARSPPDPKTAGSLENLARPSLGHWWELLRSLLPLLSGSAEPGDPKLHDFLAGGKAVGLPRAARLHAALRVALEDNPDEEKRQAPLRQRVADDGGGGTVKLGELFDRLVEYRNKVIGHQNFLGRPQWFHELMAPVMLAGVAEVLSRWDVLAGRRLVYVDQVNRRRGGDFEVQRYALEGGSARLLVPPLQVHEAEAERLPRPQCVYLEAPSPDAAGGSGRLLHPLLLYDKETEAVLFLRSRAKKAEVLEYDNLLRGAAVKRTDLGPEPRPLLARVLGLAVGSTPPLVHPPPAPPSRPRRRRLALAAAGVLAVGCLLAVYFWPRDCTLERGKALLSQGRYNEAIQCFEAIIAREPSTSQNAFRDRADACRKNGDDKPQRALQFYDQALNLEKGLDYRQAMQKYRQAIQLDPPFFWAANNLAYLLAVGPEVDLQDPNEAVRLAEDACEHSGWRCWEALDTLAVALAVRGDFDGAIERTLQALQLAPETEKALLNAKRESYRKRQPWKPKFATK